MPKLLKSGEVQLHMPRTGGSSLAKDIGVAEIRGTMHDGPEQIPYEWSDYPTVTTFWGPKDWRYSMKKYLIKINSDRELLNFQRENPGMIVSFEWLDPTFGLWADPHQHFRRFAEKCRYDSWYDLYIDYFVTPADRIVPIHKLESHINGT